MEITKTPEAFLGKEPCLDQLIAWFENVGKEEKLDEEGITADILEVLSVYKSDTESKWSDGKYYLKGQIPLCSNEAITQGQMQSAIDEDNQRLQDYGGPCNSFEAASIEHSNRRFNNLQRLLQFYYYDYPDEICYRPGGSGYQAAFESFNRGTSQVERSVNNSSEKEQ
jgi:hypothetical protein